MGQTPPDATYAAQPDFTLTADSRGVVALPGDRLDGLPTGAPAKPDVLILGVRTARGRGFAFIPAHQLNLLYFRDGHEHAQMQVQVKLHAW